VVRIAGVLRRYVADLPLERLQHMILQRSIGERVLGLGTIGFATAGTAWIEAYWITVAAPEGKMESVRLAMAAAGIGQRPGARRPVVIGTAGAIGAGKSRVAAEFGRLGAVVIDSDREAKHALDRPEVRDALASWWGPRVLGADGRVDRKAVAEIIFADPAERRRLEELVHPIVRRSRVAAIQEATLARAPAVVIDAPLLFEAGVDAECDVVVFVDAPADVRRRRVRESRGWDNAELARREAHQLDPAEKRRRSAYVLNNDGDEAAVAHRAAGIYRAILEGEPFVPRP
jgi:dephospho-CoA kinase